MPSSHNEHHDGLPLGTCLNEFRIESILGSGGFGITYRAMDTQLQRRVAIKEFFPNELATRLASFEVAAHDPARAQEFARQLKRFLNEATILAQISHSNIVKVSRYMRANGTAYFVMEYLEGVTMGQYFDREPRPPAYRDILRILHPILDGLECLHARNLLHRDIKLDNVLIVSGDKPVIIDLGVAKTATPYSVSGEAFCTPGYTPFEQYQTHGNMGPWTDLYALGATFHKIMTGELPPVSLARLEKDPYVPLAKRLASHYPLVFLRAIDQALAMDVGRRPASVAKWRLAFESSPSLSVALPQPLPPPPPVPYSPPPSPSTSKPSRLESVDLRYVVAAGFFVILAVAIWYSTL